MTFHVAPKRFVAMGNQHSAPDKDKERERDKEPSKDGKDKEKDKAVTGDPKRTASRHDKHRSRAISSAGPVPPAETKVNADRSHHVPTSATAAISTRSMPTTATAVSSSESHSIDPRTSIESSSATGSRGASPAKARRTSRSIAQTGVAEAVDDMGINNSTRPSEDMTNEEGLEPTPKFETLRVSSQASLVDEEEEDADKNGGAVIVEDLRVGPEKVPLVLDWMDGGKKVAVAGTFTGWRKRINLRKTWLPPTGGFGVDGRNGGFSTVVPVRPGTHRFHFFVDGEWRISNEFPTAVDSEGNLLNYFEASEFYDNDEFEYSRSTSISCSPPNLAWTLML